MNELAAWLLLELGHTTVAVALAGLLAAAMLRLLRVQSPVLHRTAWCATLVIGWARCACPSTCRGTRPSPSSQPCPSRRSHWPPWPWTS